MASTGDKQPRAAGGTGDGTSSGSRTTNDSGQETLTRRARRGLGGWWWLALVAVPVLLALIAGLVTRGGIQDDLKSASEKALQNKGVNGAKVDFSGRDGTVTLPANADAKQAKAIVENVDGVRVADVKGGGDKAAAGKSKPKADTGNGSFSLAPQGNSVLAEGAVPDAATKKKLVADVTKAVAPKKVIDKVTVKSGAKAPSAAAVTAAGTALGKLADGQKVAVDGDNVTLTGKAADAAAKKAAGAAATKAFPKATVDNQLTVSGANACSGVNTTVAGYLKGHQPTFANASATLNPSSFATLDKVAKALEKCSGADAGVKVQVAGYTDNTGTKSGNVTLSQNRAAAVRKYLVGKGVNAGSVTAKGFGQADPVASNNTTAGKAANRRVEITVQGG
ncbi:MAG TPA: OmpA family protein [Flexivirga sp.]|uniref:channel-forming protein ArfA/OmpATb n=1 Tax=Flexivirga sp. TaxID=1962927 RepID=UPI002D16F695|nr:OmpA family protein [Flexivirga sp.]HWC20997.1 OmpA family protein [Flexivirga sp.]